MRRRILVLAIAALTPITQALAEDVEHGRRLAERWCAACHAIDTEPTRFRRAQPFVAIAARDSVTKEMLVKFLLLPHATMANNPLSAADAVDLAAYITGLRK
ncbi:MAG: cytochrome c [Bradyrhizobium sp.]